MHLEFDNRFTTQLPADPIDGGAPRQVEGAAYSHVAPTPTAAPQLLAWSPEVAALLGIEPDEVRSTEFARVFSGNQVPEGASPFAMAYGGHQFGHWAGQLGDGRAIALGEVLDAEGGHQTLQLKGAGPTPYSRTADGRAVLRSSLREFLCSEAMHHLGIPTTRALSLVATGDSVVRDMLYDGNAAPEPGAVVCRVAPSFIRFGTFELPSSRGDMALLKRLVDYTMRVDYPHAPDIATWFREVCERTARLVVEWMRVGFVHGVLNTDNMSITGLTIDYGPYGWLEGFDPSWTPNTTDAREHRYAYGAQPRVAQWNLAQLATALVPLVGDVEPLRDALEHYADVYDEATAQMLARRLGWDAPQEVDGDLVQELYRVLQSTEIDQVIFFRELAQVSLDPEHELDDEELIAPLSEAFYAPGDVRGKVLRDLVAWLRSWSERVLDGGLEDDEERRAEMNAVNPKYVLRNWLAQEAIDLAHAGDFSRIEELLEVLRHPYSEQPGAERFAQRRPEWARTKVGSSMLSCSS